MNSWTDYKRKINLEKHGVDFRTVSCSSGKGL